MLNTDSFLVAKPPTTEDLPLDNLLSVVPGTPGYRAW